MTGPAAIDAIEISNQRIAHGYAGPDEIAWRRQYVAHHARQWLGTTFRHGARLRGHGVDCAQLLIAVYTEAGVIAAPPATGHYARNWFLHERAGRFEPILEQCGFVRVDEPSVGDVGLFRYGRTASHAAIVTAWTPEQKLAVHAFRERGVVEDECGPGTPLAARLASWWSPAAWRQAP